MRDINLHCELCGYGNTIRNESNSDALFAIKMMDLGWNTICVRIDSHHFDKLFAMCNFYCPDCGEKYNIGLWHISNARSLTGDWMTFLERTGGFRLLRSEAS